MTVELIRHGETLLQREHRYQGRTDGPLSPEGRAALRQSGAEVPLVYVSPLLRARQTAAILFPGAEQRVVAGFAEMDFGVFEGRTSGEMEHDPDYRAWVGSGCADRCPGGESKTVFCDRVCGAFSALMAAAPRTDPLVIVAHGGTMMAVLERFGRPARDYYAWQRPCGTGWLLRAEERAGARTLRVLAQTDHRKGGGDGWS